MAPKGGKKKKAAAAPSRSQPTRQTAARAQQIAELVDPGRGTRHDDSESEISEAPVLEQEQPPTAEQQQLKAPTWQTSTPRPHTDLEAIKPTSADESDVDTFGPYGEIWDREHKSDDPVFGSEESILQYTLALGALALQPATCVDDFLFPTAAAFWGLERWMPEPGKQYPRLSSGSRGPSCYPKGAVKKSACHYNHHACPFLYE